MSSTTRTTFAAEKNDVLSAPSIADAACQALQAAFDSRDEPGYETGSLGSAFFRIWMKEEGFAYIFLFRKNLRITNIQHAELLALVSAHTFERETRTLVNALQFVTPADFVATVQSLLDSVPISENDKGGAEKARWFADTYAHILRYTVAVETFFGSASIHLPPHLDIDLRAICGKAGYIHSCGRNVFVRNVSKATYEHFGKAIAKHFVRFPANGKSFFTVFAHEDFTPHDRPRARELKDGLDDVKIHIDKSYMGPDTLVDVVTKLKNATTEILTVAEPDHFRQKYAAGARPSTLWLISDYGVQRLIGEHGEERLARGRRRYYICYEQLFDNQNPFQIFDENKPAWVAHTTIPHTLMAAMINLTIPHWRSSEIVVADPFLGSGTTWIEASKFPRLQVIGSDKSPLAVAAAIDNAKFFATSPKELDDLVRTIMLVAARVERPEVVETVSGLGIAKSAMLDHLAERVSSWMNPRSVSDAAAEAFLGTEADLTSRILYYLALRVHRRHQQALRRNETKWSEAFAVEAKTLTNQMREFLELRERSSKETSFDGALAECDGDYSRSVTIGADRLVALNKNIEQQRPVEKDAMDLEELVQKAGGCDAIITDPPYGFNTDENVRQLAVLYRDVLRAALRSLKDGGQLVLCVPEISTIGKDPSAFTHRQVIAHQVIALALEEGMEIVNPVTTMPGPRVLFQPPYYWVSERALRRSILQFRVTKQRD